RRDGLSWRRLGFGLLGFAFVFLRLFFLWLLDNFGTTGPVCLQLTVLTDYHDRIRAGRHVQVWSLLHPGRSYQFNLASSGCIGGLIGSTNSTGRSATVCGGPVANETNISFGDRFLQTLVFSLCNEHCQFVRLKIETRIDYLHAATKDADVLGRIKKSLIGVNFRRRRSIGLPSSACAK